jgi:hypothetical protein
MLRGECGREHILSWRRRNHYHTIYNVPRETSASQNFKSPQGTSGGCKQRSKTIIADLGK